MFLADTKYGCNPQGRTVLRIAAMAHGDPTYKRRLHSLLREQERNGDICIWHMDDEEAVITFLNPVWRRVLLGETGGAQ